MQRNIRTSLQFERRFVTEVELEQVTGVARRTSQKHRLLNREPKYYKIHGSIRYELDEVLAWIKTHAVTEADRPADSDSGVVA